MADLASFGYYFFLAGKQHNEPFSREVSRWPRPFWPLNCPEQSENGYLCCFPDKKNNIPHFLNRPYINNYCLANYMDNSL
jgi:hypothetical protein